MVSGTPTVSCIIPCYNLAEYLPTAIESAINQTHPFDEIIIINDGSTDKTLDAMAPYHDKNILRWSGPNRGYAGARNLGAQTATGDVLVFLDADDWLFSNYVANVLPPFSVADVGAVCPQVEADGVTVAGGVWPAPHSDSLAELLERNYVWAASAIRAAACEDVGGFRKNLEPAADWGFWVALRAASWRIVGVDKVLWHWRDRPDGLHMTIDDNVIRGKMREEFPELYGLKSPPRI